MSIEKPKVGVLAVGRSTFDVDYAGQIAESAWQRLRQLPIELVGNGEIHFDEASALGAFDRLKTASLDLLLLLQVTFTDAAVCAEIAKGLGIPLAVWTFPEARTGGRLRLNSFCGVNLAAHALSRRGGRLENIHGAPESTFAATRIMELAKAAAMIRGLAGSKILVVGDHPVGFDACNYDPAELIGRFAVEVQTLPVSDFIAEVKALPDAVADAPYARRARDFSNLAEMDRDATRKTLKVYEALREKVERQGLAGVAVRCWPEFFTQYGCAACGALALLNEDHHPAGCEADVFGVLSSLLCQWSSGTGAFNTDLVDIDPESDTVVFWHCGQAPIEMADPGVPAKATIHSNRKLPLLSEFSLKPGRITLCRLTQGGGRIRMMLGGGEMLKAPLAYSGTAGVARLDVDVGTYRERLLAEGMEHHTSLVYGDHRPVLRQVAKYLDIDVVDLC